MARKAPPPSVQVPAAVRDEIEELARQAGRSVAFLVRRALVAAKGEGHAPPAGARVALRLATDEDDPADLLARLHASSGGRTLDDAVAAAWDATRAQFVAWAERHQRAEASARADDLDAELAAARAIDTAPERLAALAKSGYPRVRILVAGHAATPLEALAALARDRERAVREAAAANPHAPR